MALSILVRLSPAHTAFTFTCSYNFTLFAEFIPPTFTPSLRSLVSLICQSSSLSSCNVPSVSLLPAISSPTTSVSVVPITIFVCLCARLCLVSSSKVSFLSFGLGTPRTDCADVPCHQVTREPLKANSVSRELTQRQGRVTRPPVNGRLTSLSLSHSEPSGKTGTRLPLPALTQPTKSGRRHSAVPTFPYLSVPSVSPQSYPMLTVKSC